jgi:AcrR family transcriptional regulator
MARWEPDAPGRLRAAALELFEENGYDGTTVEDIATRAGVTKRTFFRHYPDKREVLFGGDAGTAFTGLFTEGLAAVPAGVSTVQALTRCLEHVATSFPAHRTSARRRQRVLAANDSLRERELAKMAAVAAALRSALHDRGVLEPSAAVAAEVTVAVFRTAFERWVESEADDDLRTLVREAVDALREVVSGEPPP